MSPPQDTNDGGPEGLWVDDEVATIEGQPASPAGGLVTLAFIRAALRRSTWFWCLVAVIGLLVGSGLYLRSAHNYQASTELLLTVGPEPQPGVSILGDQAIAQSQGVADLALHKLGLHESADTFLRSYTVTVLTDRIIQITASASSSKEAVHRASVLAVEFLAFRADQLRTEQRLQVAALDQQIAGDKQHVATIARQISQISAQPRSASKLAELSALQEQADRAGRDLTALEQAASANVAATEITTATMIGASKVLDSASPVPQKSRAKTLLLYVGGALIIGLILGMSIAVVRAIVSERLRRRDDVALALGAPVRSVPAVRGGRWLPGRGGRERGHSQRRIVEYLRGALPAGSRGPAALAVVPVGEPRVAATSVVSLAESCARAGERVVVADLSAGAVAAAVLGAKGPGVRTVSVDGAPIVAVVPDPLEFAPVGPFGPLSLSARSAFTRELATACSSADVLLTLISLDPSVGAEHLGTWAAEAVVILTAGKSSWTRIHAVGEMIRLAGTRLLFAVLVGADKTDESLGVTATRGTGRPDAPLWLPDADIERSVAEAARGSVAEDSVVATAHVDAREHVGQRRHRGD